MKIDIHSLRWEYDVIYGGDGSREKVLRATSIETYITYPATENSQQVSFHGYVKYNGAIYDMTEAKKIVSDIIKGKK